MVKALLKALFQLEKYVQLESRATNIISGSGLPGNRAIPARTRKNDAYYGCRLDYGAVIQKDGKPYQERLKFQLNQNAADHSIRRVVKKHGSHRVCAQVDVEIKTDADAQTASEIMRETFVKLANQINRIDS